MTVSESTSPAPVPGPAVGRVRVAEPWRLLALLVIGVAILFWVSMSVGPAAIPMMDALRGAFADDPPVISTILVELRLPRAILGVLVGATLGLSGAALQGLFRNPLAEPGIIGVSASAALGAVIIFYFGLAGSFALTLPLGGIAGAMIAVLILFALAGRDAGILTLILAGVAIASLAGALTSLALNLAPSPYAQSEIITWLLGSLADRSLSHVWLAGPFILIGWALLIASGRALDALSLGEDTAETLGFAMNRVRLQVIVGTALSVGAAVSVTGGIAFVGLVVPHLLRPLVGFEPRRLLVASALGGAALILAADIAVRLISEQTELKLGVLTAMVGAPFFLFLIYKTRSQNQ
jgi:iron complex transport system permease protein